MISNKVNFISHLDNYLNFYKNHPQLCHKQLQILKGGSDINLQSNLEDFNLEQLKQRLDNLDTKWENIIVSESGAYKIGDIIQINNNDRTSDELYETYLQYETDLQYGIVIDTNYDDGMIKILKINIEDYSLTEFDVWKGTSIAKLKDNFKNYKFSEFYKNIINDLNRSLFLFQFQPDLSKDEIQLFVGQIVDFTETQSRQIEKIVIKNWQQLELGERGSEFGYTLTKKEFEQKIKAIQKISFDEGKDIISLISYIKSRIRFLNNNQPDDNASDTDSGMSNVYD
tara:strand:- start:69 stop:920 length:852 start_codon:yes stop_codon:yes gene_type:complete